MDAAERPPLLSDSARWRRVVFDRNLRLPPDGTLARTARQTPTLVVASGIVAITAATLALWFTVSVQGWGPITGASAIMGECAQLASGMRQAAE